MNVLKFCSVLYFSPSLFVSLGCIQNSVNNTIFLLFVRNKSLLNWVSSQDCLWGYFTPDLWKEDWIQPWGTEHVYICIHTTIKDRSEYPHKERLKGFFVSHWSLILQYMHWNWAPYVVNAHSSMLYSLIRNFGVIILLHTCEAKIQVLFPRGVQAVSQKHLQ